VECRRWRESGGGDAHHIQPTMRPNSGSAPTIRALRLARWQAQVIRQHCATGHPESWCGPIPDLTLVAPVHSSLSYWDPLAP